MKDKWSIVFLFAFVINGCGNLNVYEKNQTITGASWPDDKIFRFNSNQPIPLRQKTYLSI